jgi:hypothetical protein
MFKILIVRLRARVVNLQFWNNWLIFLKIRMKLMLFENIRKPHILNFIDG